MRSIADIRRKNCNGKKAHDAMATRRQLLAGFVAGLAGAGCASSVDESPPGAPLTGGTAGSGGTTGGTASGGTAGAGGTPSTGGAATPAGSAGTAGSGSSARKQAADRVMLGATGIQVSRLAMGSGTHGGGGASDQTRLGISGFAQLLVDSYDQGLTFWETADQYGAHAHLNAAMKQVGRSNVVVLTKTHAQTEAEMEADLQRFLQGLGTDYIDVLLLHNKQSSRWTTECAGAMRYLEDAKKRGVIRAHGVSCHTLSALELAANTPWVDVDLARINPAGVAMDADPETVIGVLRQMKSAGKGVIGMKILGEGQLANQLEMAIQHAVRLDCIDGFTIGFTSKQQLDQVSERIAAS